MKENKKYIMRGKKGERMRRRTGVEGKGDETCC